MGVTDALVDAEPLVFAVLMAVALWQWAARRDAASRELAATFGVLAGALVGFRLVPDEAEGGFAQRVLVLVVLLFPYFLLRFAATFEAPPRWVTRTATVLVVSVGAATMLLPKLSSDGPMAWWMTGYLVLILAEWGFVSLIVAGRLWRAGAGLPRVARRRMRTLSTAAAVLTLGVVASIIPTGGADWVEQAVGLIALGSGALFMAGFAPPAWLVRLWRGQEAEVVQRLVVGLVSGTDDKQVLDQLLPRLLELVGARGVTLVDEHGVLLGAAGQIGVDADPEGPHLLVAQGVVQVAAGHVRVEVAGGALHVWTGPYAPWFGRAEFALLASMGSLLQLSLERTASSAREREAADALAEAQQLARIGSWRWVTGSRVPQWSREMYRLYGVDPALPLAASGYSELIHPEDRERVDAEIARALTERVPVSFEYRIVLNGGPGVRWVQSRVQVECDGSGEPVALFGTVQDVSERRNLEHELQHQARHDPLTGLPNRRLLVETLADAVDRTSAVDGLAVLFLDVDRFKIVNDSLGHEAGDQVLLALSDRLTAAIRAGDAIARFGGDEFIVVGHVHDEADAMALAERLHAATAPPLTVAGTELVVTLSTGIALCRDGSATAGSLVRDADAAMYTAKRDGGGRTVLFAEAMRTAAVDRLAVEVDLRRGLADGQLRVHYQPVFDVASGALVGAEALARWQHPVRGLLEPADFIGAAEETGLIVDLGREVLRQACHQLRAWQDDYAHLEHMWISVNLSARQIFSPGLTADVVRAVQESGIAPDRLTLEITESVLMTDVEDSLAVLGALRALGVRLSVDDFGTGYSSLAYLTRLPVSSLKVDRSFLSRIDEDPHALAVVQAVVALADALGLEIVAEGVESATQLQTVRRLGVGLGQGFHLGRPGPAAQAGGWLSADAPVLPSPREPRVTAPVTS